MTEFTHYPFVPTFGKPDQFKGQNFYMQDENTLVIKGSIYRKIDQGFACGGKGGPPGNAVMVFSGRGGGAALMSHPPYCNICPTCWHTCGKSRCPDWSQCGEDVGNGYGFIVTFPSMGWLWTCMGKISYKSTSYPV